MSDSDATPGSSSSYKAVVGIAPPADERCGRFERGHHGHPVQVALAMKQAGDDKLFRPVRLSQASSSTVGEDEVASIIVVADDDAERIALVNHDPAILERLGAIDDPFFVWEPKYGVLFFMTEQAREVMGTGSMTFCLPEEFVACQGSTA